MLEWTTRGTGARPGLLLRHSDADREWGYDRDSRVGRLDNGLDVAQQKRCVVVSMKDDWSAVFPK